MLREAEIIAAARTLLRAVERDGWCQECALTHVKPAAEALARVLGDPPLTYAEHVDWEDEPVVPCGEPGCEVCGA